jgi:hypothetical protein
MAGFQASLSPNFAISSGLALSAYERHFIAVRALVSNIASEHHAISSDCPLNALRARLSALRHQMDHRCQIAAGA